VLRTRLYYNINPLVPLSARLAIRRWFALRKREQVGDVWPILPGSERPPEGWPGWPEGKQFALVLTHDVEGQAGLDKCRQLMELELKLGFRSSFNFVPEHGARVSRELREELTANGFEVGVHDLHHDGKLFRDRESFVRGAVRINHYLKDWGAVGFRAAFMLHNLDWLHDLNIQYDASTFDTDPFEPHPNGQHTIFPFWVPRSAESAVNPQPSTISHSGGYVELPYTLVQDSTLFLLLGERHPDIWFQKLDWIARHGGMALLDTHPDYMAMNGASQVAWEYPAAFYAELLQYIRSTYSGACWHALPRQVAGLVAQHRLQPRPKPRRICMVTYSHYLSDARVKRYAEALAERGDYVDVVALQGAPGHSVREKVGNVNLVRLQPRFGKNEKSKLSFLLPVLRFLFVSSVWVARRHARKPYDLLHIHNVPDFLVFAALYPKLGGAKVILDIHDIVPEFYASKFGARQDSAPITMLKWAERASARFADHVIISNHLWLDRYAARTGSYGKCSVFINHVDPTIFRPRPRARNDGKLIILFPGGLQWHQGLDVALRAFQRVSAELSNVEFHIYGDGDKKDELVVLSDQLGLNGSVRFFDPLPVSQIAEVMANADLGVVPKRADSFGNEAYSTKTMEFMSLGVPVVISNTKIDRYYFDDSVVRFFESGNADALAEAVIQVFRDQDLRRRMVLHGSEYAARNNWDSRKGDYLKLVDDLCVRK